MFKEDITLSAAPMRGEQSAEILSELGFEEDRINTLIEKGVIDQFK